MAAFATWAVPTARASPPVASCQCQRRRGMCDPVCNTGCGDCYEKCSVNTSGALTCNAHARSSMAPRPARRRREHRYQGCCNSAISSPMIRCRPTTARPARCASANACGNRCYQFCRADADCPTKATCSKDVGGGYLVCDVPTVACDPVNGAARNPSTSGCSGTTSCYLSGMSANTLCDCQNNRTDGKKERRRSLCPLERLLRGTGLHRPDGEEHPEVLLQGLPAPGLRRGGRRGRGRNRVCDRELYHDPASQRNHEPHLWLLQRVGAATVMNLRRLAFAVLATAAMVGCYSPNIKSGGFTCGEGGVCPDKFRCALDNRCYPIDKDASFDLPGRQAPGLHVGDLDRLRDVRASPQPATVQPGLPDRMCSVRLVLGGRGSIQVLDRERRVPRRRGGLRPEHPRSCKAGLHCQPECAGTTGRCYRFCSTTKRFVSPVRPVRSAT